MVFCSVWLYIAFSRGQFVSFIRNSVQIHCHTKTGSLAVFIRVEGKSLHSDRTNIVWPYHSIKMSFGLRDHTVIMHFLFRSIINAVLMNPYKMWLTNVTKKTMKSNQIDSAIKCVYLFWSLSLNEHYSEWLFQKETEKSLREKIFIQSFLAYSKF